MRNLLFPVASAFALLCAAGPLVVQTSAAQTAMAPAMMSLTSAQQIDYNSWTPEQRAVYGAWPADSQTYYWTLSLNQMHGWWKLTDLQRSQIVAMTPDQRASTWASVEAQLAGKNNWPKTSAVAVANT